MRKNSRGLLLALAFFVAIIYLWDTKEVQFYLVPSDSMVPTLETSDYIVGFGVKSSDLQHGDIVVFGTEKQGGFYVKRIIGMPGDTIAILKGVVYRNGQEVEEPYVENPGVEDFGPITVPKGRVFVMGDNRTNSLDSRWFGPVPTSIIRARVSFIYSPIGRMGSVR
jgi:signal peptidase I